MKKVVIAGLVGLLGLASPGYSMMGAGTGFGVSCEPTMQDVLDGELSPASEQIQEAIPRIGEPLILYADTTYSSAGHFSENDFPINKAYPYRMKIFPIHTREGDCLDRIAQELSSLLHKAVSWPGLYAQNKEIIGDNPHYLVPGMDLKYAAGWEEGTFIPNKVGMIVPS